MADANTANLKGTITFLAKLDENSFKSLKAQIKGASASPTSGGGGSTGGGQSATSGMTGMFSMSSGKSGGGGGGGGMDIMSGILGVVQKIFDLFEKLLNLIMESSPLMQSMAKLFNTSMKLIFMPVGNMLAKILMPIMIKYMQNAAKTAEQYANAPPSDISQVMADSTSDMIGALTDTLGAVFFQIMPPLLEGLVQGIEQAVASALTGGGNSFMGQMSSIFDSYNTFAQQFSASNLNMSPTQAGGTAGDMNTINQFGEVLQTANNTIGTATSQLATTFYSSNSTIEDGFTNASTVFTEGTTNMLNAISGTLNTGAAGINTAFNTTTGYITTGGQDLETAISGACSGFVGQIDTANTPIEKLTDSVVSGTNSLNSMANAAMSATAYLNGLNRSNTLNQNGVTPSNTSGPSSNWAMGLMDIGLPGFSVLSSLAGWNTSGDSQAGAGALGAIGNTILGGLGFHASGDYTTGVNSPELAVIGDNPSQKEHVLTDSQLTSVASNFLTMGSNTNYSSNNVSNKNKSSGDTINFVVNGSIIGLDDLESKVEAMIQQKLSQKGAY